ncbi:hypothetical protein AMJ85_09865, partial [candidate division BRC1 bacterium SM23_51]
LHLCMRTVMSKKTTKRIIRIAPNHDGSFRLTYVGFKGPDGKPLTGRASSKRAAKAMMTRWRRQCGEPDAIEGLAFIHALILAES